MELSHRNLQNNVLFDNICTNNNNNHNNHNFENENHTHLQINTENEKYNNNNNNCNHITPHSAPMFAINPNTINNTNIANEIAINESKPLLSQFGITPTALKS